MRKDERCDGVERSVAARDPSFLGQRCLFGNRMLAVMLRRLCFGTTFVFALTDFAACGHCKADELPRAPAHPNQPPAFYEPKPDAASKTGHLVHVRAGKSLAFPVSAIDPDGDDISYRVQSLPAFGRFDPAGRVVVFAPKAEHYGSHSLLIEASDGRASAFLRLTVNVVLNRPASPDVGRFLLRGVNEPGQYAVRLFSDDNGDALTIVSQRVPSGAKLVAQGSQVALELQPTESDVGVHPLSVSVSDGDHVSTIDSTLVVVPEWSHRGWGSALLPVVGASAFLAHSGDRYAGGAFDVTLRARRRPARDGLSCTLMPNYDGDCYAGQFRIFSSFEVLSFGGLYQSKLGHRFQTRAALGLWLWSDDAVWLSAALGYRVVPAELSLLTGATVALRAQLNPW
jgi:hypothetical protein